MEAETQAPEVPRVKLGSQGLEVWRLGLGCFQLTRLINAPLSDEEGIAFIKQAFDRGITFFDTADRYGQHKNEILIGKALKELPREKVQVASKFGIVKLEGGVLMTNGKCVRACCEASLDRLGVEHKDLCYQHRVDLTVRIEDTMRGAEEVSGGGEGEVHRAVGGEPRHDQACACCASHPITALQMRWWSFWTRDIKDETVPLCRVPNLMQMMPLTGRDLGIGIVAFSPLVISPYRFSEDNLENTILHVQGANLAAKHGCNPAQPALAWLLHQGNDVFPIPGTRKFSFS
ncbi:hypothetical protein C4D60_Mb08t20110 [Musa balbisiana]|uniref:NADP-dependent oxidoreductase domain-containing protein n=1 Tax=Musa balbisiana TaxID=52838 RepID=A0A4S8K538_MUSBA|nr:hypothetical protein C4D60_Mb08t20110 [Musa balbisiana]